MHRYVTHAIAGDTCPRTIHANDANKLVTPEYGNGWKLV